MAAAVVPSPILVHTPHHVVASVSTIRTCHFAPKIYKIGVTGGIASGKSSLLQLLKQTGKNLVVLDCDKLGHNTYLPGTNTYKKIIATFGDDIVGKQDYIDRRKLAQKVFANKSSIEKLNKIVWPEITKFLRKKILCCEAQGIPIIVIEAALLLESGVDLFTDEVWALGVPDEEAVRRVIARGLSAEDARKRISAQLDLETRKNRSDFFIDSYHLSREENAVRILKRMTEIELIAAERQNFFGGKIPVPESVECNPTMCKCMFVNEGLMEM